LVEKGVRMVRRHLCQGAFSVTLAIVLVLAAHATGSNSTDIADLNLESLIDDVVVSTSKHTETIEETPASVSVITRETIDRYAFRSQNQHNCQCDRERPLTQMSPDHTHPFFYQRYTVTSNRQVPERHQVVWRVESIAHDRKRQFVLEVTDWNRLDSDRRTVATGGTAEDGAKRRQGRDQLLPGFGGTETNPYGRSSRGRVDGKHFRRGDGYAATVGLGGECGGGPRRGKRYPDKMTGGLSPERVSLKVLREKRMVVTGLFATSLHSRIGGAVADPPGQNLHRDRREDQRDSMQRVQNALVIARWRRDKRHTQTSGDYFGC